MPYGCTVWDEDLSKFTTTNETQWLRDTLYAACKKLDHDGYVLAEIDLDLSTWFAKIQKEEQEEIEVKKRNALNKLTHEERKLLGLK